MFKHIKSSVIMLGCLLLLLVLVTVSAIALQPEYYTLEPFTYHNPLFPDTDTEMNVPVQPVIIHRSGKTEYGTVAEASVYVREQMKERQQAITVSFVSDHLDQQLLLDIFHAAMEHTGDPTEGDYLLWQYDDMGCSANYYTQGGSFYATVTYTIHYYTTEEQEKTMDTAIAALRRELDLDGLSNYEKISVIYDWITSNVTYDYDNLEDDSYKLKHTAYAALQNKTAVCQGYALLLYRLLLEEGIDNRIITGDAGGAHAWNIIQLDDLYYNADATWDSAYVEADPDYAYYLKGDDFFTDHTPNPEYTGTFETQYPISATDYIPAFTAVYGDVNGDDMINTKDVILLRKHLTGSSVEVGPGADANADGSVNESDLALLREYVAGKDPSTGESPVVLGPAA